MTIESPFLTSLNLRPGTASDEYPFSIPLVRRGAEITFDKPVTIICGENGSGKSTLIESIALHCGFALTGGSRNHNVGQQDAELSELQKFMKFAWKIKVSDGFFMRAESFFNFSSAIDTLARESGCDIYRSYGGKSLHAQSHGEAFLSLFSNRLGGRGLYLLDEPEAALSPQRQLALIGLIHELEQTKQAQFIIATHSPLLMAYPNALLLFLQEGELVEKNFKATTHFQIMARFFADPESYIEKFLAD